MRRVVGVIRGWRLESLRAHPRQGPVPGLVCLCLYTIGVPYIDSFHPSSTSVQTRMYFIAKTSTDNRMPLSVRVDASQPIHAPIHFWFLGHMLASASYAFVNRMYTDPGQYRNETVHLSKRWPAQALKRLSLLPCPSRSVSMR